MMILYLRGFTENDKNINILKRTGNIIVTDEAYINALKNNDLALASDYLEALDDAIERDKFDYVIVNGSECIGFAPKYINNIMSSFINKHKDKLYCTSRMPFTSKSELYYSTVKEKTYLFGIDAYRFIKNPSVVFIAEKEDDEIALLMQQEFIKSGYSDTKLFTVNDPINFNEIDWVVVYNKNDAMNRYLERVTVPEDCILTSMYECDEPMKIGFEKYCKALQKEVESEDKETVKYQTTIYTFYKIIK